MIEIKKFRIVIDRQATNIDEPYFELFGRREHHLTLTEIDSTQFGWCFSKDAADFEHLENPFTIQCKQTLHSVIELHSSQTVARVEITCALLDLAVLMGSTDQFFGRKFNDLDFI